MQEQNTSYSWFSVGVDVRYSCKSWQHNLHIENRWAGPFVNIARKRK
jgi:hypothetical protein